MNHPFRIPVRRSPVSRAVSFAVALMTVQLAHAQAAAPQEPAAAGQPETIEQVQVVGTRASERSSIARKKNAATAQDSIIADDIGSFPDRNVAEAISRISGVTLERSTTDIMSILNLAWWPVRDKVVARFNRAKTIARPPVSRLAGSAVVCTYDEVGDGGGAEDDGGMPDMNCSGRSLDDVEFSIRTYENMPATSSDGIKVGGRTAFTWLPWYLRHTGLHANFTKIRGKVEGMRWRDLIIGEALDPVNQQDRSWNASLWYDDGALNMRVALQVTAQYLRRIANDTQISAFPAPNVTGGSLPYNPGAPLYRDARRFIDVRVGYKFKNGLEVFAEGRNIGKSSVTDSTAHFQPFSDGVPTISNYSYGGAKYMVGLVLRN